MRAFSHHIAVATHTFVVQHSTSLRCGRPYVQQPRTFWSQQQDIDWKEQGVVQLKQYDGNDRFASYHISSCGNSCNECPEPPTFNHKRRYSQADELPETSLICLSPSVRVFINLQSLSSTRLAAVFPCLPSIPFQPFLYPRPRFCVFNKSSHALWATSHTIRYVNACQ